MTDKGTVFTAELMKKLLGNAGRNMNKQVDKNNTESNHILDKTNATFRENSDNIIADCHKNKGYYNRKTTAKPVNIVQRGSSHFPIGSTLQKSESAVRQKLHF